MYDTKLIKFGNTQLGINPLGGYVTSWKIGEKNILYIGSSIRRTGIPILFPYYGKSHTKRMHGIGRDATWRVTKCDNNHATMELSEIDLDEQLRPEFPYKFTAKVTVLLENENTLAYTLSFKNNDDTVIPLSPGLHPYWRVSHEEKSNITLDGLENFNAELIDWNNAPPDNPFPFTQTVTVHLNDFSLRIEETTQKKQVKFIQIWSQTPVRDPDYNFICVEPICGLNYGIEEHPIQVQPGNSWEMQLEFSVTLK